MEKDSIVLFIGLVEIKVKKNKKVRLKFGKVKDDEIFLGKYIFFN